VADLLGIASVLVPADAGLLSALGLGAAVVERFAHRQVLEPLDSVLDWLPDWIAEMGEEAAEAVAAEGIGPGEIGVRRRLLNLRFAGQEATLAVELRDGVSIEDAFSAAYREIYGYAPEGRAIELESIRVVASSRSSHEEVPLASTPVPSEAVPRGARRSWFGAWRNAPFFDRADLRPGASFEGPALVFEDHSATAVREGWRGWVDAAGTLVLKSDP
jgi:5-oxoprolinase (ATP-hydrolysing)